jgi:hypothetical protein
MSTNGIPFRQTPHNCVLQEIDEKPDFTESRRYQAYERIVRYLIRKAGDAGLWGSDLNKLIKNFRNDLWTNSVVADTSIEEFGGARWKYRMRTRYVKPSSTENAMLFVSNGRDVKTMTTEHFERI